MSSSGPNKRPRQSMALPTSCPDYPPEGADFCLISSDGVAFGFTGNQFRQSTVFSRMISLRSDKRDIQLVDRELETATAIKLLLDMLTGKRLDGLPTSDFPLNDWAAFLLLAKKYRFTQAYSMGITTCSSLLFRSYLKFGHMLAVKMFCLAARIEDDRLAFDAVELMSKYGPADFATDERTADKKGGLRINFPQLDSSAWPVTFVQMVPTAYLWALGRAAQPRVLRAPGGGSNGTFNSDRFYSTDVLERFKWFLQLAKKELGSS